jgi:hypothetical protein
MAFPIIPKRRSGAPGNPASLQLGELAVNTADGELYLGGDGGVMLLNGPVSAGTTVTEHTGDGTTVAFTFGGYNGTADGGYIVSVGGIDQPPSKYSISSTAGGTITFVEAPVDGELISIRAIVAGSGGGGGSGTVTSITAGTGLEGGTITDSGTISLASITTAQSNVGSSTAIPVLSINDQGQVTALTTAAFVALTTAQIAGLSTTAPAALSTTAIAGLSTFAARADHAHLLPSAADIGALGATAAAGGDLAGNYPNPTLAAITTAQNNVGSSTLIPVLSIDAKGRVTALSTASAGGNATQLQGRAVASTEPTERQTLTYNATTQQWEPYGGAYTVEVLLVGGGGSGASAGGGGGGGLISSTNVTVYTGNSYGILIGAGGAGGTGTNLLGNSGSSTTGFDLTALGGGGGGRWSTTANNQNGLSGGSGGGAGLNSVGALNAGGDGTTGQGFAGGNANQASSTGFAAGGGGGAGAVGGNKNNQVAGSGGAGALNAINGSSLYWAGGGGSGSQGAGSTPGNGGIGGGGGGANGVGGTNASTGGGSALNAGAAGTVGAGGTGGIGGAGGANTGGGGGAMAISQGTAGSGGSGILILRYLGAQRGAGGTVTSSGGYTIHTFTTSANFSA